MDKPHEYQHIDWINMPKSDMTLNSLPGIMESLSGENHKINIISYLAEWCPNCHYEAIALRDLYRKFSKLSIEMAVVMNYSEIKKSMSFVKSYRLKMNIFYGELIEKQEDSLDKLLFTQFRKKNNDLRKWGTPFHIIIKNGNIENIGIVKGEFMIKEIEDFLTNKLMA